MVLAGVEDGELVPGHTHPAQHAESIISFGGVAAETRRIRERLEATMEQMRAWNRQMVKEEWISNCHKWHTTSPLPPPTTHPP